MTYTYEQVAKMIDTSLLNPGLDDNALEEGCVRKERWLISGLNWTA